MGRNDTNHALVVVFCVSLVCALMVSSTAILLRPVKARNQLVTRSRDIVSLSGLVDPQESLSDQRVLELTENLDMRVVALSSGEFVPEIDPLSFDARAAAQDPARSVAIPAELDGAGLQRRAEHQVVYLVWEEGELKRLILPIYGQGMWSTIGGYLALESDFNTIAEVVFSEQQETAGLGDKVAQPEWHRQWRGQRIYEKGGRVRFRVARGPAREDSSFEVDGLTGATITGDAVTRMIAYWFGPHGYESLIERLRESPPSPLSSSEVGS